MTDTNSRLDRRAEMLASRMNATSEALGNALGSGGQPPFTTAMGQAEAFAWWRAHRHDEYGKQVVDVMQPIQVMELDAWLGEKMAAEREPTNA